MASQYQQTTDKDIQDRVRSKYRGSIGQLKMLNFEEFCFFSESVKALGLSNGLFGPLGVNGALPNEVMRVERDLSVNLFFLVLVSREYDTYVSPFALGTKFYTSFTDGTCVITANFDSPKINDDGEKLYKFAQPCSISAAWKSHQSWVNKLTASGKQRNYHLAFDDFARLARREDSYMLKPKSLTAAIFRDTRSTVLATIIFVALLVAITFLFLVLPSLVHILYPACWSVRNLGRPSLPQSFLITFACIITSWLLARVQNGMYTVNGAGTMLRGQTPLPTSRGYISTKWLVFMFLPLLPVRSYQVFGEYSDAPDKKYYDMQSLDHLHWAQIRETIWEFKWWYVLVALLWIGIGA
jgi:hypothetical protein